MINKFWESLGEKLADRWMGQIFGPSSFFWTGGVIAWIYASGWETALKLFTSWSIEIKVMILIVGLLSVLFSSSLIQLLVAPTRRLLEGQWPSFLQYIRYFLIKKQKRRLDRLEHRWQFLSEKGYQEMTNLEQNELAYLEIELKKTPYSNLMPTRFGNIQRACENSIRTKYGLDVFITLPRLKLLLPDTAKQDLNSTLQTIDSAVSVFLWGLLFLIWNIFTLWATLISFLLIFSAYKWALSAAEMYSQSLECCYDLYRFKLYEAMQIASPKSAHDERIIGKKVSAFLWNGSFEELVYTRPLSEVE